MTEMTALTMWNVAIDSLGLMVCIGALILARRINRSPRTVVPAFDRDVDLEMLRQRIAGSFATLARCMESERQSLEPIFGCPHPPLKPAAPDQPPQGISPTIENRKTVIDPIAARGHEVVAANRSPEPSPGEVELRLKLKRASIRA